MAALVKTPPPRNMLTAFLVFSSAVHLLVLIVTFMIQPLFAPKAVTKTISFNFAPVDSPAPAPAPTPAPEPAKAAEVLKKTEPAKTSPPLQAKKPAPPLPAARPNTRETPVTATLARTPAAPSPVAIAPSPVTIAPAPIPAQPAQSAPPAAAAPLRNLAQEDNDSLAQQVDSLLSRKPASTPSPSDYLAGGSWTGSPRKTLAFPNIKARIAELDNSRGLGYSVTARITFTAQGWVSMVELTRASGDPRIDHIFRNELRKIRIEESPAGNIDTVMKSFVISVQ